MKLQTKEMKKILYAFVIFSLVFSGCTSPKTEEEEMNDTPTAVDDSSSTNENTAVNINVLANDSFGNDGPNSGSISIPSSTTINGATIAINNAGTPNDPTDDITDDSEDPTPVDPSEVDPDCPDCTVTILDQTPSLELLKDILPVVAVTATS